MSADPQSGLPRLLAAGESHSQPNAHVGYVVGMVSREVSYHPPLAPGVTWVCLGAALVLLWRGLARPSLRSWFVGCRAVVVPLFCLLLGVVVLPLPLDLPSPDLGTSLLIGLVWLLVLLAWVCASLAWLVATARASGDETAGRYQAALLVGMLMFSLVARAPGARALRPQVLRRMTQTERVAASTEAQALRLGRWPTAEEWQAEHGRLRGAGGARFEYLAEPREDARKEPWRGYTIVCRARRPGRWDGEVYTSRDYGADGLFATSDDYLTWLQPEEYGATAWPHGRAPRDPNVKLPPWPTAKGDVP
ncbi:MAG: hypothetical protein HZB16_16230 [Armatimonadetes bacterium]|nr:hypothetical protein [Armatimonadota bacterium]